MAYRYNSNHQDNNRPKKRLRRFFGIVAVLMAVLLVLCAYAGKFNPEKFFTWDNDFTSLAELDPATEHAVAELPPRYDFF